MSGFTIDWLNLREAADQRARDAALRERARQWLKGHPSSTHRALVIDLGAGTGSTLRALDAHDPSPWTWRLVDHDPTLLTEAQRRHGSTQQVATCVADLTHSDSLPLEGARLVTASALFDLVSGDFIEALVDRLNALCAQQPLGLYAALNYDGVTQWTPAHPLDDTVLDAFNRDQRTDKGFGSALGPTASTVLEDALTRAGFTVTTARSPWVLNGADQPLVTELINGIAGAVANSPELDTKALADWVQFRQSNAASGTCIVGHTDVLALPA